METGLEELEAIGKTGIERRSAVTASAHRPDRRLSMDSQETIVARLYLPPLAGTAGPPSADRRRRNAPRATPGTCRGRGGLAEALTMSRSRSARPTEPPIMSIKRASKKMKNPLWTTSYTRTSACAPMPVNIGETESTDATAMLKGIERKTWTTPSCRFEVRNPAGTDVTTRRTRRYPKDASPADGTVMFG